MGIDTQFEEEKTDEKKEEFSFKSIFDEKGNFIQ